MNIFWPLLQVILFFSFNFFYFFRQFIYFSSLFFHWCFQKIFFTSEKSCNIFFALIVQKLCARETALYWYSNEILCIAKHYIKFKNICNLARWLSVKNVKGSGEWEWEVGKENRNENIILVGKFFLLSQNCNLNTCRVISI